ncbi:MAG: transglutaminase-like domain-containing protein [archaeon]|nr:transglutaminase-like domain-containing protein [archaeon]
MKKLFPVVFLFLCLVSASCAYADTYATGKNITDVRLVDKLVLEITETGRITVTEGDLKWMKINITAPQQASYQQVTYTDDLVQDELGNNFVFIYEENPGQSVDYVSKSSLLVNARATTSIPSSYAIPDDVKIFLQPTENIQSDDFGIISIAGSVTKGSRSDFEKVARLAIWVNEYITYDLGYSNVILDAVEILDVEKGVCAEYTTLFVALARASNIPARYVSGFAYGEDGWEEHAYSEVYLGKWVPVDALWLEVGNLDATHVRYTVQADNQVKNDVKVYGSELGQIVWETDDKTLNTVSVSYAEPRSDFVFGASSVDAGPGDDIIFFVRVKPEDYRVLDFDLEPCLSDPVIIEVGEKKKRVIFEPGSEDMLVYWIGHVSSSISDRVIYTCPLTLNSDYLEHRALNVTISGRNKNSVLFKSSVSKPIISLGDMQEIEVDVTRTGGDGPVTVGIVYGNYRDGGSVDMSSDSGSAVFIFRPDHVGTNEVIVYSSTGDIEVLSFDAVEKGSVYIESLEYSSLIKKGDFARINISIRNDKADDASVKLYYGGNIDTLTIPANFWMVYGMAVDTSAVGERTDAVRIIGQDIVDAEYADIVIYDIPDISYDYFYDYAQAKLFVSVYASLDDARNVTVSVGDMSLSEDVVSGSKTFSFNTAPADYSLNIYWEDMNGSGYTKTGTLSVSPESFFSKIVRLINEFVQMFVR